MRGELEWMIGLAADLPAQRAARRPEPCGSLALSLPLEHRRVKLERIEQACHEPDARVELGRDSEERLGTFELTSLGRDLHAPRERSRLALTILHLAEVGVRLLEMLLGPI